MALSLALAVCIGSMAVPASAKQKSQSPSDNEENFHPIMFLPGGIKSSNFLIDIENLLYYIENQNLDIAITDAKIEDARGNFIKSFAPFMPSIEGEYFVERYDGGQIFVEERPVDVKRKTYYPKVTVSYEIPLGGKPIFQLKASKSQLHRAKLRKDRTYQAALYEGLKSYFTLMNEHAKLNVVEQSLKEANEQTTLDQRKYELGFIKKLDVMESKALELDRQSMVLEAKNAVNLSKLRIATLLNVPLTWNVELKTKTIQPVHFLKAEKTLEQHLQTAKAERADVKEMDREIKEAKLAYKMVRSDLFPTLNLSHYMGGVGPTPGNLDRVSQYGGRVFVNLLRNLGIETLGNMKSAKARIKEAMLTKQKRLNDIYQTISRDYYNTQMYRKQTKVMSEKKAAAEEAYRIARLRKKAGLGTTLEVIQLETAMMEAQMEHSSAILNYNVSQLKLLMETGQLTTDHVLEQISTAQNLNQPFTANSSIQDFTPEADVSNETPLRKTARHKAAQKVSSHP